MIITQKFTINGKRVDIGFKNDFIKPVTKLLSDSEKKLPPKLLEKISRKGAKDARNFVKQFVKGGVLSPRMRKLIHSTRAKKEGNKWVSTVLAEKEAAFFQSGVKQHIVSFYNPKKASVIGTPRAKFRRWFEKEGMDEESMKKMGAIKVSIPRTNFMYKIFGSMTKSIPNEAEKWFEGYGGLK